MEEKRSFITFTLPELWLLHAFIRHDIANQEQWKHPPVSSILNAELAHAIYCCEEYGLKEFTLVLKHHDLLTIDFYIREDHKSPAGAKGREILLKVFRARVDENYLPYFPEVPPGISLVETYEEAKKNAESRSRPDEDTDDNAGDSTTTGAT